MDTSASVSLGKCIAILAQQKEVGNQGYPKANLTIEENQTTRHKIMTRYFVSQDKMKAGLRVPS